MEFLKKKILIGFFTALVVITVSLAWLATSVFALQTPKLIFFDVGQGDAIFISAGSNQVLIDGGAGGKILEKLGKSMPFLDKKIELIIVTHPDKDHIGGLVDVLSRYEIEEIMYSDITSETKAFDSFKELIKQKNIKTIAPIFGQVVDIYPKISLEILYPFGDIKGQTFSNENNISTVAKLIFGQKTVLLTGDAEEPVEIQLQNSNVNLKSDILKVGHHGSKSASSANFIKTVSPSTAIISVGKDNSYGHPHQEVLDSLSGIDILRTDLLGDIEFNY